MLAIVLLAQFMVILDIAIVNVALPSIRTALHFSDDGLEWVVNAYTLTFAGFLMLGGRAADLLGRRRVLLAGTGAFALCSLACALASSRGVLLGARALQGVAGALMSPATLSILSTSVPEGRERNRALGAWAAVGGLGASSGALLGGALTQTLGWPAIFAINAPLGALVVFAGMRVIPAGTAADVAAKRHFDLAGAVLVTTGLAALTFGIVRTTGLGWGSSGVLAPMTTGLALVAAFVYVEGRIAQAPLVPLSIFRNRALRTANLVIALLYIALFSMWYFLTLYIQVVLGHGPLSAGVSFLPLTLSVFTGSSLAPALVRRFGTRRVLTAGMLMAALGLTLMSGLTPTSGYLFPVLPAGILSSLGMGFSLVPATITATQGVERARAGAASGLVNTSRLVGGAIGLAVLGTIAQAHTRGEAGAVSPARALTDGYSLAFTIGALVCVAGAGLAAVMLRPRALAVEQSPLVVIATDGADEEARAA
jgi:EmrB/QacA subfamily drug resistance transporter